MKSDIDPSAQDPRLRQRCLDYLLGEMSPREAMAFESQLDVPAVAHALVRESDLLCQITTRDAIDQVPPPLPSPTSARPIGTLQRITVLISALAATLLVISLYSMNHDINPITGNATALKFESAVNPASFEFELAKTWVQPAVDWETDAWEDEVAEHSSESQDCHWQADFGEAVSDETFSWMVVAVKASIHEGNRNDG